MTIARISKALAVLALSAAAFADSLTEERQSAFEGLRLLESKDSLRSFLREKGRSQRQPGINPRLNLRKK